MQPAAAQRLGSGCGVLPIAFHDAVALCEDFADFAGRQFAVAIIDDLDENPGTRHAARAEAVAPARMGVVGMHAFGEACDRHRRLALAVSW